MVVTAAAVFLVVGLSAGGRSGTASAAAACPDAGSRMPVILVHGQYGDTGDFTDHKGAATTDLVSTLGQLPNVALQLFDYEDGGHWVTDPTIGQKLSDYLTCEAATSRRHGGAGKVVVVTHSMGGLALRQAAALTSRSGQSVADSIGLAVTVAAPNTGSWSDGLFHDLRAGSGGEVPAGAAWLLQAVCGVRHHAGVLCGVVQDATSESGSAMVPGSAQLASLPQLPSEVPVDEAAGELTVKVQLFHHEFTLANVGDLLVKPDSALANASRPGTEQVLDKCTLSARDLIASPGWVGCAHGGLLYDHPVVDQVSSWVAKWLGTLAAQPRISTTTTTMAPATTRPSPTTAPPAGSSLSIGADFDSSCVVAWPTAPTYTSQGVEMTMSCRAVPESTYLFTDVVYDDPNFQMTPSTGSVRVKGRIVDVARSQLGYSELVVEASSIDTS